MNKRGFTLAEVLIALTIVGVIAAITLPTFLGSTKNQSHASQLSTCINSLETAFTTMMAQDGVDDMEDTKWAEGGYTNALLADYLKITTLESGKQDADFYKAAYGADNPFKTIGGVSIGVASKEAFQMNNGAYVMIAGKTAYTHIEATAVAAGGTAYKRVLWLYIDVNGKPKPNVWGRDTFDVVVDSTGHIHGLGTVNGSLLTNGTSKHWSTATDTHGCNGTIKSLGCTGRLMENNYKMDY